MARADDDLEPDPTEPDADSASDRVSNSEDDSSEDDSAPPLRDLSKLEPPGRWQRQLAIGLMAVTALLSLIMAWSLAGQAVYTLRGRKPLDLGSLATAKLGSEHANRFVRAVAPLEERPLVRYRRLGEQGFAVVAPVNGRHEIWVEHELADRAAGPRFVTPSRFTGRLVPLSKLGAGYWGVAGRIAEALGDRPSGEVWVLVDGATPQSERWTFALALLMVVFGGWNLLGIYLVTKRYQPS